MCFVDRLVIIATCARNPTLHVTLRPSYIYVLFQHLIAFTSTFHLSSCYVAWRPPYDKVLAKVHEITAYVHGSTPAKTRLLHAQEFHETPQTALPKFSPTRWWSATTAAEAFVKNKHAVVRLCELAKIHFETDKVPILTDNEWQVRILSLRVVFYEF